MNFNPGENFYLIFLSARLWENLTNICLKAEQCQVFGSNICNSTLILIKFTAAFCFTSWLINSFAQGEAGSFQCLSSNTPVCVTILLHSQAAEN